MEQVLLVQIVKNPHGRRQNSAYWTSLAPPAAFLVREGPSLGILPYKWALLVSTGRPFAAFPTTELAFSKTLPFS